MLRLWTWTGCSCLNSGRWSRWKLDVNYCIQFVSFIMRHYLNSFEGQHCDWEPASKLTRSTFNSTSLPQTRFPSIPPPIRSTVPRNRSKNVFLTKLEFLSRRMVTLRFYSGIAFLRFVSSSVADYCNCSWHRRSWILSAICRAAQKLGLEIQLFFLRNMWRWSPKLFKFSYNLFKYPNVVYFCEISNVLQM